MKPRIHYAKSSPGVYDAMDALDTYLSASPVDQKLLHLIRLRVSQLNGCAYCIDMHWKDLIALGDQPQRLYSLDAWEECPFYTDAERAALAYAEAVTFVAEGHVKEEAFAPLAQYFDERAIGDITLAIATINAWNRLSISARLTPGTYKSSLGK
jgi:AhpD family alkylhydroperoxidase